MLVRHSLLLFVATACASSGPSILVENALVLDGTGAPGTESDVRVHGGIVIDVGQLEPGRNDIVIDATGLVLAPGFIDTHSHHDRGLADEPTALAVVSQGVTTIVVGQDGGSPSSLAEFFGELESDPAAINVAAYTGHNMIRRRVMGDEFRRHATDAEVDSMSVILRQELEAGALGLSTGLEYDPGIYSTTEEVLRLASVTAEFENTRYISHMRSEDRWFWDAVDEIIHVGRESGLPVQISHMKLAMKSLWGETERLFRTLNSARDAGIDVTADVYPYEYWQSTMTVLFPERDFTDRAAATFALTELAPPEGIIVSRFGPQPDYVGMTVSEIAVARSMDPVTTYMDLIAEALAWEDSTGRNGEGIIARSMRMDDIAKLYDWEHTNVSSDGGMRGRHPRGFGSFTRVLAMVREDSLLSLEGAVYRMTGLAARHMGFTNRGMIEEGAPADLVLFNPETVADRATFDDPQLPSVGIERVWVNGVEVYDGRAVTGARPGVVILRSEGEGGRTQDNDS